MNSSRYVFRRAAAAVLGVLAAGCAAAGVRHGAVHTPALRFVSYLPPAYQAEFSYADPGPAGSVQTASFRQDREEVAPHSPWLLLPPGGPLGVDVRLMGTDGAPLASGRIELPRMERELMYEVQVQLIRYDARIPRPPCIGCFGEARFAVRPGGALTANDSLVVTWSARNSQLPMPPS